MENAEMLNRFINIISTFKSLEQKATGDKLIPFTNLITELNALKAKVYPERLESAKIAYKKNNSAFKISAFELMEYNFRENSHSNVLQYLFDHRLIGDVAIEILTKVVKLCDEENSENLIQKIQKKRYRVIREQSTDTKKRIDLFIVDDENQFVIAIENKILASISERIDVSEESESIIKNQLDYYKEFVYKKYPKYEPFLLLMHFNEIVKEYNGYKKLTYKQLSSILNTIEINDNIFIDYKILLKSLNNGIHRKNKIELIRTVNSWENKLNIEVLLNEIEQIKTLSYDSKQN